MPLATVVAARMVRRLDGLHARGRRQRPMRAPALRAARRLLQQPRRPIPVAAHVEPAQRAADVGRNARHLGALHEPARAQPCASHRGEQGWAASLAEQEAVLASRGTPCWSQHMPG